MVPGPSDKPPRAGFFIARDLPAEDLGPRRRPNVVARIGGASPAPAPAIPRLQPSRPPPPPAKSPRRTAFDPRSEGAALSEEVAFGHVVARKGPPTVPARAHTPETVAASRAAKIVDELGRCGPGAEQAFLAPLRALGEPGIEALCRSFPGLLWFDRNEEYQREPRGRDVCPSASLLHSLGSAAHPHVLRLLENSDADVRFYATLLAVDIGAPSFVEPLVGRLFDPDVAIVRHALAGVRALGGDARILLLGEQLVALLRDTAQASPHRLRAIELLGTLRNPYAVEALVEVLDAPEHGLGQRALRALRLLTAHELGVQSKDWRRFVRERVRQPRFEWLLDGLVSKNAALRDLAAVELATLTGETHGYVPGVELAFAERVRDTYARALPRG